MYCLNPPMDTPPEGMKSCVRLNCLEFMRVFHFCFSMSMIMRTISQGAGFANCVKKTKI